MTTDGVMHPYITVLIPVIFGIGAAVWFFMKCWCEEERP